MLSASKDSGFASALLFLLTGLAQRAVLTPNRNAFSDPSRVKAAYVGRIGARRYEQGNWPEAIFPIPSWLGYKQHSKKYHFPSSRRLS